MFSQQNIQLKDINSLRAAYKNKLDTDIIFSLPRIEEIIALYDKEPQGSEWKQKTVEFLHQRWHSFASKRSRNRAPTFGCT